MNFPTIATGCAAILLGTSGAFAAEDPRVEFFEKKVRPVLINNCYTCHSASTNSKGGLRVDDRNGLLQGGNSGPAVVPGQPDKSLLIQAVRHVGDASKMPPKKKLTDDEIADLTRWVKEGVAWPEVKGAAFVTKANPTYDKLRKEHWAWQPLREANAPPVKNTAWPGGSIDRFILAKLEAKGLNPATDADRLTLLRRVTFDLTGLPPTPQEIDAFLADRSTDAFSTVVERLLASPAFGEQWGRHWLDVARYGESTGSGRNVPYPHAWRYRDYVIDAFNADKPYDRFIREQIAGDLLPAASDDERDQQRIATGFLALGVKDVNQRFKVRFIMDNIDEQIDTISRSVLALTASCARCHDHKFDPIPTADYYALAGIFHSTDLCAGVRNKMGGGGMDYYDTGMLLELGQSRPLDPKVADRIAEAKKAVEVARAEFEAMRGKAAGTGGGAQPKVAAARQKMNRLQNELLSMTDPAAQGRAALGVREGKTIGDTQVRIRGEAEKLGPSVARGFLSVVNVPNAARINPSQSGRLELAHWLTHEKNPMTARVMVNRVWHHCFGRGIVSSVDNFGITGDVPTHPELLDYLAADFMQQGWSVKKLVRSLVLSRAYQQSSMANGDRTVDPANRLVWRHSPRRLAAEEIRDGMLSAAGTLDRHRPEASPAKELKVMEMRNNGPEAGRIDKEAQASLHRGVYLPLIRGLTPRGLEVFDFASQGTVTGSRDTTTVATQALYMLNDPFVRQQSRALAERLLRDSSDDAHRMDAAYRLTLGRSATAKEVARVREYLAEYPATGQEPGNAKTAAWASFCQALVGSAEFRYVR
jgi:hypothetical protein